jgi:LysM repeat protein
MGDREYNASDVIEAYRRRRERMIPLLLGGAAVLLLVIGLILVVLWVTGDNPPAVPGIFASDTPTATETATPPPPTETPTITDTPTITLTPTPSGPQTYLVQEGDTLVSISEQFGVELDLLVAYNPDLADGGTIFVSQEIIIPPPDAQRPTGTPLPDNLVPGSQIDYVVVAGDTVASIAEEFLSTVDAIIEENELEDPNDIRIGDRLVVPVFLVTPAPTDTPNPNPPTATATLIP